MEYIPVSELLIFFGLAIVTPQYQIQANQDSNQKYKKYNICLFAKLKLRRDSDEMDFR